MPTSFFAGLTFTFQETLVIYGVPFLAAVAAVTILVLSVCKILQITSKSIDKNLHIGKTILFSLAAVIILIIVAVVMPEVIKDKIWINKQDSCAIQAGYKDRFAAQNPDPYTDGNKNGLYSECVNQ